MAIAPDSVGEIFISHFHKDHYEGVGQLHDYYAAAQLLVPTSLQADVFQQLFNDRAVPTVFGEVPETMERARLRRRATMRDGLRFVHVNWSRPYGDGIRLSALSPLDGALLASAEAIAARMDQSRAAVRKELRNQNWCSVVLHVDTPAGCVLLGSDLENSPARYGWAAVLAEPSHQHLRPADIVKVPHHGSPNADHEPMWTRLVTHDPLMTVAPFNKGSAKRPTRQDCIRLSTRGQLWQAAPTTGSWLNEFGHSVTEESATGLIQARRRHSEDQWRIRLSGNAFHVNPLLS